MRPVLRMTMIAAVAVLIAAAPPADFRAELQKMRAENPQQYARLRHNLAVFLSLPLARQESLRDLDRQLHEEPPPMRNRLERVMERYTDWLEHLSETDRRSVLAAPDRPTRLQRIRTIREQQWLNRQPRGEQERIAKLAEPDRSALIRKLWQDSAEDRMDWSVAQRLGDGFIRGPGAAPTRLEMLADERPSFEQTLRPLLSRDAEKQLNDASGKWPRFPRILVELGDQHPLSVLGPIGPTSIRELRDHQFNPLLITILEKDKKYQARLKEAEGKWPDFGVALRDCLRDLRRGPGTFKFPFPINASLPPKYSPSRRPDFPPSVLQFIDQKLLPALDAPERTQLKNAEGDWPAYPRLIVELARKHNLTVPSSPRFEKLEVYRWRSPAPHPAPAGRRGDPFRPMFWLN
jgi:hypothetical protein